MGNDIQFRVQAGATQYYGDGFHGIDGVSDGTHRTDVTFAQVLTFTIKGDQPLRFSVKEIHVGSGSADVAIATEFSYKFSTFKISTVR